MASLPNPILPPPDPILKELPRLDDCSWISRANAAVVTQMNLTLSILQGRNNLAKRSTIKQKKLLAEVLLSFASPWSGIVPPLIPLLCRHTYSHMMSCRRMAWNILDCYYDESPVGIDDPDRFYQKRWSRQGRRRHIRMLRSVL